MFVLKEKVSTIAHLYRLHNQDNQGIMIIQTFNKNFNNYVKLHKPHSYPSLKLRWPHLGLETKIILFVFSHKKICLCAFQAILLSRGISKFETIHFLKLQESFIALKCAYHFFFTLYILSRYFWTYNPYYIFLNFWEYNISF